MSITSIDFDIVLVIYMTPCALYEAARRASEHPTPAIQQCLY